MDAKELNKIMFVTRNLTVLIAEDDEVAIEIYRSTVQPFFKDVKIAKDGAQAYEIYSDKDNQIDIVVTDINMPHLSGLGLINKIRSTNPLIPIIVVSAYTDSNSFIRFIEAGVSSFLPKPLSAEALFHCAYSAAIEVDDARLILEYQQKLEDQIFSYMQEIEALKKENIELKCKLNLPITEQMENGSGSKHVEKISSFDKSEFGDAIANMQNHQAFITGNNAIADRTRLNCIISEMQTVLMLIHKHTVFDGVSRGLDKLCVYLMSDKDSILANKELLDQFITELESFYVDVVGNETSQTNGHDKKISELVQKIVSLN